MPEYNVDEDRRSGNTLIHGWLAAKGLQPTAENVRMALHANAQDPGLIKNEASTLYNNEPPIADAVMRRAVGDRLPTPPIPPTGSQPLNIREPDTSAPPDTRPIIPRPNGPGPLPPDEGNTPLITPPVGGPGPQEPSPVAGNIVPPENLGRLLLSGAPLIGGGAAALGRLLGGPTTPLGIAGPASVPAIGGPATPLALAGPAAGASPLGIAGPEKPLAITHDPGFNGAPKQIAAPDPMASVHNSITQSVPGDVVAAPKAETTKAEAPAPRARKTPRRLPKKL
jgi:hypothetical protein